MIRAATVAIAYTAGMGVYDAIVIGVGGMGSAACAALAARGQRVLGIERFGPAHDRGSSHGRTRIYRTAYFEHPDYVPLARRAVKLWQRIEQQTGTALMHPCGLVLAGPDDCPLIAGTLRAADVHDLPLERLTPEAAERRFAALRFERDHTVLFEQQAGYLDVEPCVEMQIELARRHGAELHFDERVRSWDAASDWVVVRTDRGEYSAGGLVLAGGAWSAGLLEAGGHSAPPACVPLKVRRKMQLWFASANPALTPACCPVFGFHVDNGFFYGFPAVEPGMVKVAEHTGGQVVDDVDQLDRSLRPADVERVGAFVARCLRGVGPDVVRHAACMYTMTPDEHFVLDHHPEHAHVIVAAGFSGHGFKFCPLVGTLAADLLIDGRTDAAIGFLAANRFQA